MADLVSQIEVFVSCENLPNKDTFSKSDPCLYVYCAEKGQTGFLGHTEVVKYGPENGFYAQNGRRNACGLIRAGGVCAAEII